MIVGTGRRGGGERRSMLANIRGNTRLRDYANLSEYIA